ncbi:MAG: pyridoxamine 5'-phosphate oxidase family protein [Dehalococcoidia bacterium]
MSDSDICTIDELRQVYGLPPANSAAVRIVFPSLHKHHQSFIALSPFLVIASADAKGVTDVSPKGDLPGFVTVLDEHTLIIPDRPGNKKLLTLSNVVENPSVSLIFFIPGRVDTVRVNGKAQITTDPTLLAPFEMQGKIPQSALVVTVEQAWLHCGKALIRSQLWEPEAQVAPDVLPTLGQMTADQITNFDAAEYDQRQQTYAKARRDSSIDSPLWGEPKS